MTKKVTMKDLAEKLEVSINAVSLALNDKEGISDDLRIKTLELAVEMNYPLKKINAKDSLKNKTLVVLINEKKRNDKFYYLDILNHIKNEATIFGYRILIEYYQTDNFTVPECISDHRVAGCILLGKIQEEAIRLLRLYIKEIICVNHSFLHLNIDSICTNDYLGGYLSCEYLIKKGYKKIGFVGEISSSKNFQLRYDGYKQCMIDHFQYKNYEFIALTKGIENAVLNNDYQYIQKMLITYRKMPEAFVCVNDRNARILINALSYCGYKIPQDIKIIGFDNMNFSATMTPPLSTLEVDRYAIGKRAVRRMHEMIHEETTPETISLSPKIIERSSTQ